MYTDYIQMYVMYNAYIYVYKLTMIKMVGLDVKALAVVYESPRKEGRKERQGRKERRGGQGRKDGRPRKEQGRPGSVRKDRFLEGRIQ
jgi:hypothetical protein